MQNTATLWYALLLLAFCSCKNSGTKEKFLPPSTGAVNSVIVVMDNELWKGQVGENIRAHFAAAVPGLPQAEPRFTLIQVPPQVFKGATAHARSVLWIVQDTVSKAYTTTDVYAQPQKIAVVKGKTPDNIIHLSDSLASEALAAFKTVELQEAQKRFTRSLSKDHALEETFGIHLSLPSLYNVGKRESNFIWMDLQIPKGTLNLIAYQIPWNSLMNKATLEEDILKMRDSIGEQYIPGPYEGTFMITEKTLPLHIVPVQIAEKKAIAIRGIWEINGYPMAGPFLTYIINDPENHRKLVVEGFVFAPSQAKRDYMFELEAILKTLTFKNEA